MQLSQKLVSVLLRAHEPCLLYQLKLAVHRLRAKAGGGAGQMFKMFKEMDRDASGTIDAKE